MIKYLLSFSKMFKENQIADSIASIRENITTTLHGPAFSSEIRFYTKDMAGCDVFLVSKANMQSIPSLTKAAYLYTTQGELLYYNAAENPALIQIPQPPYTFLQSLGVESPELDVDKAPKLLIKNLSVEQKKTINEIAGHRHLDSIAPFANVADDPKQIARIKELVNALYHAERTFYELENIDLDNLDVTKWKTYTYLKTLYSNVIEHAYEASYLLTHLDMDIDLRTVFGKELTQIMDVCSSVQKLAQGYQDNAEEMAQNFRANKVGAIAGRIVDQMEIKPSTGKKDFNFLTDFSASLPGYLKSMTNFIQKYSSDISQEETSTLNKEQIDAMKEHAIKLLHAIESIQDNDAVLSFKTLHYINVIRHLITISTNTIEQMQYMGEASQKTICDNIAVIKYEVLPQLFALVDKMEDEALLAPGFLSKPLMEAVEPYYDQLIELASKPVDFSEGRTHLLVLNDAKFVELRLQETQQRINQSEQNIFKIKAAEKACSKFFMLLKRHSDTPLIDLPSTSAIKAPSTKELLIAHYKSIQDYVQAIDIELHNNIVYALTHSLSYKDQAIRMGRYFVMGEEATDTALLLTYQKKIEALLERDKASQEFRIRSNNTIINSVSHGLKETLRALPAELHHLRLNEKDLLSLDKAANEALQTQQQVIGTTIVDTDALSTEQVIKLYTIYKEKDLKRAAVLNSFTRFMDILANTTSLDNASRERLKHLYLEIQPALLEAFDYSKKIINYDRSMVDILNNQVDLPQFRSDDFIGQSMFEVTKTHFQTLEGPFTTYLAEINKRFKHYEILASQKYAADLKAQKLLPNVKAIKRAHFVLSHTEYSEKVGEFKASLLTMTKSLNDSVQAQLKPAKKGVPYPEMENPKQALAESKQIATIKRMFNTVHSLEQFCLRLEKLNNKSSKVTYVWHLYQQYNNVMTLKGLIDELSADPYLSLTAKQLLARAQALQNSFMEKADPYLAQPAPTAGMSSLSPLWQPLLGVMLIPEEIQALHDNKSLTAEEIETIQRKTLAIDAKIQDIFDKSDNYFQLFLKVPEVYSLYKEIKQKFVSCTSMTHDAIIENIKELNSGAIAKILMEADVWEDKLGLKPGQISGSVKDILSEFHQGFLQSLELRSDTHLDCLVSLDAFEQRKTAAIDRIKKAEDKITDLTNKETTIKNLIGAIRVKERLNRFPSPSPYKDIISAGANTGILRAYQDAIGLINDKFPRIAHALTGEASGKHEFVSTCLNETTGCSFVQRATAPVNSKDQLFQLSSSSMYVLTPDALYYYNKLEDTLETVTLDKTDLAKLTPEAFLDEETIKKLSPEALQALTINKLSDTQLNAIATATGHRHFAELEPLAHNDVLEAAETALTYYQGLIRHQRLKSSMGSEKVVYLNELIEKQRKDNVTVVYNYTQNILVKTFNEVLEKLTPPLSLKEEYQQDIAANLGFVQDEIVTHAISLHHLNAEMVAAVKEIESRLKAACAEKSKDIPNLKADIEASVNDFAIRMKTSIAEASLLPEQKEALFIQLDSISTAAENELTSEKLVGADIQARLHDEIMGLQASIQDQLACNNIHKMLKQSLDEKVRQFDAENMVHYEQLNQLLAAINEFSVYFDYEEAEIKKSNDQNTLFEDKNTIESKKILIDELEKLALDTTVPIADRVKNVITKMDTDEFKDTMMAYRKVESFGFDWLKKCVLGLLQAVHLYTPRYESLYNNISKAPSTVTYRDRFFAQTPEVPNGLEDNPEINTGLSSN